MDEDGAEGRYARINSVLGKENVENVYTDELKDIVKKGEKGIVSTMNKLVEVNCRYNSVMQSEQLCSPFCFCLATYIYKKGIKSATDPPLQPTRYPHGKVNNSNPNPAL